MAKNKSIDLKDIVVDMKPKQFTELQEILNHKATNIKQQKAMVGGAINKFFDELKSQNPKKENQIEAHRSVVIEGRLNNTYSNEGITQINQTSPLKDYLSHAEKNLSKATAKWHVGNDQGVQENAKNNKSASEVKVDQSKQKSVKVKDSKAFSVFKEISKSIGKMLKKAGVTKEEGDDKKAPKVSNPEKKTQR